MQIDWYLSMADMKPSIHIVGCPRSGTTLLAEMINACYSNIEYPRHEETILDVFPGNESIRLSKKPNDSIWLGPVLKVNTGLRVLAVIRDPRAVLASQHRSWPGMYFCNYTVWKKSERSITSLSDHPRVMQVRYEDLILEPDLLQERIEQFMGFLTREYSFPDYHKVARPSTDAINALDGLRAIDRGRLDGWKKHRSRIKQQLEQFPSMLDDLVRHGYEKNNDWVSILDDVQAKDFLCRYSDRDSALKQLEQSIRKKIRTIRYKQKLGKSG